MPPNHAAVCCRWRTVDLLGTWKQTILCRHDVGLRTCFLDGILAEFNGPKLTVLAKVKTRDPGLEPIGDGVDVLAVLV